MPPQQPTRRGRCGSSKTIHCLICRVSDGIMIVSFEILLRQRSSYFLIRDYINLGVSTYSSYFYRKILSVCEQTGLMISEIASHFCIDVASMALWLKEPDPKLNRNKSGTTLWHMMILTPINYETTRRLSESVQSISHTLRRMNMSCKKILTHLKADADSRRIFQTSGCVKHNKRPIVYNSDLLQKSSI